MGEEIVIVSAVRTPIGRYGGALKNSSSGHLASIVIKEAIKRANIAAEQVDEVIFGEVRQTTESSNVARVAALRSGIPDSAPAFTVNRLCASGMQAIASAAQQISSGQANIVVAGGTESMSRAPLYLRNSRFGGDRTELVDSNTEAGQQPQEMYGNRLGMGITAENVAQRYNISREEQDAFSIQSQRKAALAIETGKFKNEIVPVQVSERKGTVTIEADEYPRPDTTLEKLAALRPAFKENGTVTAGNACGRNDGASALVLMKANEAKRLRLQPIAKIVDWAAAGVSPEVMGIGPVPAVGKLLERTGKKIEEIGLVELNEAFASQALAVIKELALDESKVNVNGGAIALGHPVGSTGARIVITLIHEMIRRKERYGIATLCVGGGQGMAIMVETI
ncbi:thiolase family protein [Peribacillus muralis]|uniref:thiolase family protein n=1 Tax=Peribacillus muralis TaxID=264697 RepID=UPI001F4EEE64|nr:thiolase family protein [Peribacillus muralis]MCK1993797.1 thiolase family protein [Peribacillus muralis]MCK2013914.1 thiolase family protein [Peribacillus muralis]